MIAAKQASRKGKRMRDSYLHDAQYEDADLRPVIFCFAHEIDYGNRVSNDYEVYAMAENGVVIAGHISSTIAFAKYDIGINSQRKHDRYKKFFPGGYRLEWIDENELENHSGYKRAFKLNQAERQAHE